MLLIVLPESGDAIRRWKICDRATVGSARRTSSIKFDRYFVFSQSFFFFPAYFFSLILSFSSPENQGTTLVGQGVRRITVGTGGESREKAKQREKSWMKRVEREKKKNRDK